jgi:hypothetical protein
MKQSLKGEQRAAKDNDRPGADPISARCPPAHLPTRHVTRATRRETHFNQACKKERSAHSRDPGDPRSRLRVRILLFSRWSNTAVKLLRRGGGFASNQAGRAYWLFGLSRRHGPYRSLIGWRGAWCSPMADPAHSATTRFAFAGGTDWAL